MGVSDFRYKHGVHLGERISVSGCVGGLDLRGGVVVGVCGVGWWCGEGVTLFRIFTELRSQRLAAELRI